jgi:hypothetical protein
MPTNLSLPPINPYETPMEANSERSRLWLPSGLSVWQRFHVLGIGIFFAMLIAIPFAIEPGTSQFRLSNWAVIMAGPLMALVHRFEVPALGGIVGGLLAVSHPIMPRGWTVWLTILGLILWFWSGCVGLSL